MVSGKKIGFEERWQESCLLPGFSDHNPLYHYCNADTFLAIITNNTIRISDLTKMNDYMETQWGIDLILKTATEHSELTDDFQNVIIDSIKKAQTFTRPLAACFSRDKDVLSQWRAYADDGRGFAIGIHPTALDNINGVVGRVLYKSKDQIEFIKKKLSLLQVMYSLSPDKPADFDESDIGIILVQAACFLKNAAFSEEGEIRIVKLFSSEDGEDGTMIVDPADSDSDIHAKYRISHGRLTPFEDARLPDDKKSIVEVVLGPRNEDTAFDVRAALNSSGFLKVTVSNSSASYR